MELKKIDSSSVVIGILYLIMVSGFFYRYDMLEKINYYEDEKVLESCQIISIEEIVDNSSCYKNMIFSYNGKIMQKTKHLHDHDAHNIKKGDKITIILKQKDLINKDNFTEYNKLLKYNSDTACSKFIVISSFVLLVIAFIILIIRVNNDIIDVDSTYSLFNIYGIFVFLSSFCLFVYFLSCLI